MSDLHDFFERNGARLSARGLWSRGGEFNTLDPREWDERPFRVLVTRLSSYEDTSLSFTHDILYALFAREGWFPDWSFLPDPRDRDLYASSNIPWLFGVQTKRTARDFGAIAVSNSISQETGNLFWFLKNSGIPIEKSRRMEDPLLPLILMGGANSGSSSVLVHPDPLVDGIFTGEDFGSIARLFRAVAEGREQGLPKRDILERLESVDGFFQPDRLKQVKKFNARTIDASQLYAKMPVNWGEGNAGKAVLPISEGCAGFCSFCNESFARKPYREAPVETLLAEARNLKAETGADRVDLYSFNFNMHRDFYALIEGLVPLFRDIGLKSQRFDSIAEDPALIETEKALGKSVFTCGLEGVSERMRRFLNKNLDDAQVRKSVEVLVSASVREIKVFLIATGREEESDFREWDAFLSWAQALRTPQGKQVRFVFSVTPLVRFPHTPLEFEPRPPLETVRSVISKILSITQKKGFECRQAASAEEAFFCDILLRADRSEIYEAFRDSVLESGFVYDREISPALYRLFLSRLTARGLDPEKMDLDFSFEKNATSPWAALDLGVSRAYLKTQYERNAAYGQIDADPAQLCGRGRTHPGARQIEELKRKIALDRKDEFPVGFPCLLGERWAHVGREYPALYVARALMKADPALVPLYRGFASSFWQPDASRPAPLWGVDRLTLLFRKQGLALLVRQDDGFWARVNAELAPSSLSVSRPSAAAKPAGSAQSGPAEPASLSCALRMTSPVDVNPEYLVKNGLKHIYAKTQDGTFAYQLTKDALKKNIILSLGVDKSVAGIFTVNLVPGAKFDLDDFLLNAFRKNGKNDWLSIRTEALS